ncbi:MAG: hypothetical protein ACXQTR_05565 [Candidatus Methanospirareceae archaeon]
MRRTFRCNRCGKKCVEVIGGRSHRIVLIYDSSFKALDLCDDCIERFLNFLKNFLKEAEEE